MIFNVDIPSPKCSIFSLRDVAELWSPQVMVRFIPWCTVAFRTHATVRGRDGEKRPFLGDLGDFMEFNVDFFGDETCALSHT